MSHIALIAFILGVRLVLAGCEKRGMQQQKQHRRYRVRRCRRSQRL